MKKRQLGILICSLLVTMVMAQSRKDSLWAAWNNEALPDTQRLKAIQALTWPMMNVNLDSAYLLANMQLDFARSKQSVSWEAKAYYNIATTYYYRSDYAKSLSFYEKSLALRKKTGDLKGEAAIYGNFALIYGDQGNTIKGLEYLQKSLAINERIRDTSNLTSNYSNLAILYQDQQDTAKALSYYRKVLLMYDPEKDQKSIALVYNNIGSLYRSVKAYDKALHYLNESLTMREKLGDRLGMAVTNLNLGTAYNSMARYPEARKHVLESIHHFNALGDPGSLANSYYTLCDIENREGRYQEALKWCKQSLEIADANHKQSISRAANWGLYIAHKNLKQFEKSLVYLEDYLILNDSLKSGELQIALNRMEFEKETLADSLAREEEKANLQLQHQTEISRKNRTALLLLASALGVLILALIFLSRMLAYQRNARRLEQRTEQLEKQQLVNEISLLKTQVNPHFLFNSLSILSSLVRVNPDLSEQFIEQLSRSYRYILEQKDQSLVTLRTELGFIESYAFLLKIRFENKFNLHMDIPAGILDVCKIAPLTLQLLVENAVKHNRMSLTEPLIVEVTSEGEDMLVIRNKLQPRSSPANSTGVGLQNIINRYALLTDRPVWAGETEDQFVVRIPLLKEGK